MRPADRPPKRNRPMDLHADPPHALRYGFLLLPRYSMIAFSSMLEPLRMANQLRGATLYEWVMLTMDGRPVAASNGLMLPPDAGIDKAGQLDLICVCGGLDVRLASRGAARHHQPRHL